MSCITIQCNEDQNLEALFNVSGPKDRVKRGGFFRSRNNIPESALPRVSLNIIVILIVKFLVMSFHILKVYIFIENNNEGLIIIQHCLFFNKVPTMYSKFILILPEIFSSFGSLSK